VGGQIISGYAQLRYRETSMIWNTHPIGFFLEIHVFRIVHPFLRSSTTRWAALLPTANKSATDFYGLMRIERRGPAALHRLQQLIQHLEILVLRLQLSILLQRRRSGTQIAELVIDERQVEID
jgi:hypothetical protein